MRISDWSSTCALPIYPGGPGRGLRHDVGAHQPHAAGTPRTGTAPGPARAGHHLRPRRAAAAVRLRPVLSVHRRLREPHPPAKRPLHPNGRGESMPRYGVFDESGKDYAEEGQVMLDGTDVVPISMTADAAEETGNELIRAAAEARQQLEDSARGAPGP